jgi:hypothetical protein
MDGTEASLDGAVNGDGEVISEHDMSANGASANGASADGASSNGKVAEA